MPSSLHESVIELFRVELRLIETLVGPHLDLGPEGLGALSTLDSALTDPRPIERRADLAILPERGPAFIVEVQLSKDADKRWSWPSYVALTRDRLRREVLLVVIALDPDVARWAARPIRLDSHGSVLRPVVIGPDEIPVLTDPVVALAHPEQLVLSALVHGRSDQGPAIAAAAAVAMTQLDVDRARTYSDLIFSALGPEARAALEAALFEKYEFQSDFFRRFINEGKAEGQREGQREGALRALMAVLRARNMPVSPEAMARIEAVPDADTLLTLLNRAIFAASVEEALAEDSAALAR